MTNDVLDDGRGGVAMMVMVYIVGGVSALTPGIPMTVHQTHDGAAAKAASLVNVLLGEAGMRRNATPANHEKRLNALLEKMDWYERADVWITEKELEE